MSLNRIIKRAQVEEEYEFKRWTKEIPSLHFKPEWDVTIIPPFCCAIVRFYIDYNGRHISCYLDCYDELGYFGSPYWEIFPYHEDVARFAMNDTESLMKAIEDALKNDE